MSVLTATDGIDPRIALASSIHASPGVYAVLVGSGLSTAAGIPTGWGVVQSLVERVATLEGVELEGLEPDEWFESTYGSPPRYDELLERLAESDHTRRALLRDYFEHPPGMSRPPEPTDAHRVLAELCATGRVRVVLTTNFDHLLERALEAAGASPQVLITADDRAGMEPLQHARTTLIKLHGDYRSTMLNTAEELGEYRQDLASLVDEVLDRYGLIVAGWSAEYDRALEGHIAASLSRRYPMYWLRHDGQLTESASRLIAKRRATVIDIDGADEFFLDLERKLQRLDDVAVRRRQPAALWDSHHAPYGSRQSGWEAVPLLQLRTVAVLDSVRRDECSPIGPAAREAVVDAMAGSGYSSALDQVVDRYPIVSAAGPSSDAGTIVNSYPLGDWIATPGGFQNTAAASYRRGGDATSGISALLEIWLPRPQSGNVLITLDTAMSLRNRLDVTDAVSLWHAGVIALTGAVPDAMRGSLPDYADVTQVELHVIAPTHAVDGTQRANSLLEQLDLRTFGEHAVDIPATIGQAMRVDGAVEASAAAELVIDALERMLLNGGFLDPRGGIAALRERTHQWTVTPLGAPTFDASSGD
jgi:hypothetical protein